jgi:zinc/manganese transport system permease protein
MEIIDSLFETLILPFADFGFMRRAFVACIALGLGGSFVGPFLVLRRMTLVGDAMSHAILPGASIAFLLTGVSLLPMAFGGLVAGIVVASLAALVAKNTSLNEDSSFTGTHLLCLSSGILLVSIKGNTVDLIHVLFGNVLAVDNPTLILVGVIVSVTLLIGAWGYREMVVECFDSGFLASTGTNSSIYQQIFMLLLVLNLVASFHALGTLMALGLLILPAIAASFWTSEIDSLVMLSSAIAILSSLIGLLVSFHANLPSGPSIVFIAGLFYLSSLIFGSQGSLISKYLYFKTFNW